MRLIALDGEITSAAVFIRPNTIAVGITNPYGRHAMTAGLESVGGASVLLRLSTPYVLVLLVWISLRKQMFVHLQNLQWHLVGWGVTFKPVPSKEGALLLFIVWFWCETPQWAWASSLTRFLDHTQRRNTVGRIPLDEWSARRRDLYLTTHNTHNRQASMPSPVG